MRLIDSRWGRWLALGLAAVVTVAIYLPSANGPFLYDDIRQILHNANLHDPTDLYRVVFNGWRQIRVWQNLTFALNWAISPGETWSFKLTNVLLHLANGALLLSFLKRAVPDRPRIAWLTAFFFLVHPLQIQSVAYVMGRVSLLQAFFTLAVLNLVSRPRERPWLVAAVIVSSLVAKESCALIPLAVVLYDLTLGKRSWRSPRTALYLAAGAMLIPIWWMLRDPVSMYRGSSGFDLLPYGEYLVTQLHYVAVYPFLVLNPASQSIIHPYPSFDGSVIALAVAGSAVVAALATLAWRLRERLPIVTFTVGFYFLSLAPTNSFLQMKNPFAEYRLYQPNILWMLLLALGIEAVAGQLRRPAVVRLLAGAATVYFCAFTAFHNSVYADAVKLYSYAAEVYPWSSEIHGLLGSQYEQRGRLDLAEQHFLLAADLTEQEVVRSARPRFRLARMYVMTGRYAEALEQLRRIPAGGLRWGAAPEPYYELMLETLAALGHYAELARTLDEAETAYGPGAFDDLIFGPQPAETP